MKDALGTKITVTLLTVEKQAQRCPKMELLGRKTNRFHATTIKRLQDQLWWHTP